MPEPMQTLHSILFIILLHVSKSVLQSTDFRCDYVKVPAINSWVKFHEIPSNWFNARLRCQMEGAVLASPLNEQIRALLVSMMISHKIEVPIFTGIHATFSQGDYASIEGVPLSKILHKWAIGEPNNFEDSESCLVLFPDGTMGDVRCKNTYPYICYKAVVSAPLTECGTIDSEYTLDKRTGSCYKFHRVPRTWSRAYMNCMAEGGYLAVINKNEESEALRDLFAQNVPVSMIGTFWKDVAFVGFQDWNEHADWRTIQGQTLKEAGFDRFAPGEPNNSTTGEYCGAIYRSGLFDDLWCENEYAFICEKDPRSLLCDGPKY